MAKNNSTEVVNGIVQPRIYQVYGDLIESKEIMEPTAITAGSGPICGFDWVDTTKANLTIQSVWNANGDETLLKYLRNRSKNVVLSTKENEVGRVYNAYTSPAGLVFIAPGTLVFNGVTPPNGWPNLENPDHAIVFCVIAQNRYTPTDSVNPPSITDFRTNWLSASVPIAKMLSWNFNDVMSFFNTKGIKFNPSEDVLIGLYIIGWDNSWDNDKDSLRLKPIIGSKLNYRLCLNPYDGKLPVSPYIMNPLDIPDIKATILKLEDTVNRGFIEMAENIEEKLIEINNSLINIKTELSSIKNSRGEGIEIEYTIDSKDDLNNIYRFTKLIIQGCKLVENGSSVEKTLAYQSKEGAFGLIIYSMVPIVGKTSIKVDQWGIAVAQITMAMTSVDRWDGNIDFSNLPNGALPLALFDINYDDVGDSLLPNHAYTLINNPKVDGPTRLALSMPRLLDCFTDQFNSTQPLDSTQDKGSVYLTFNSIFNATMGIISIDVQVIFNKQSTFNGIVNFGSTLRTLINNQPKWESIINNFLRTYSGIRIYRLPDSPSRDGTGPLDYFMVWELVIHGRDGADKIHDDAIAVKVNGNSSPIGPINNRAILTFPIIVFGDSGSSYKNLLKIMDNPFKY